MTDLYAHLRDPAPDWLGTRSELADLWRKAIAAEDAVTAAIDDLRVTNKELHQIELDAFAAQGALRTHLHLIGLTKAEIEAFPL